MDDQQYWNTKHDKYAEADWIDKPSLFAQWVVSYLPGSGVLLDLGAGQGQDSRYFAAHGYRVTAADLSPRAIELGQQKSGKHIIFQQIDLSQPLPFDNNSFDVVYAHLSLHYFDSSTTRKLFAEIHRILKPEGVLAAMFNSSKDPQVSEGIVIEEPHFLQVGGIKKRFFTPEAARQLAHEFEVMVADDQGTRYKEGAQDESSLVRLIARKKA